MSGHTVDTAIASCGHATFALLKELRIPYDELHFGKPHADIYVDSRSLNALADIERDLGWHVGPSKIISQFEAIDGAIDARSFNLVRAAGREHVIKSSKPEILRGECHWYRSIPLALADLFPEPVEITDSAVAVDGSSLSTIKMARVAGVTFSHLVTARLLTKAGVRRLVGALHRIHSQGPPAGTPAASETRATNTELCYNYANKVASRARKHQALYASLCGELGLDAQKMTSCVLSFLEEFEAGERAQHAYYIHGDPVFSNVIRTHDDRVVLIDMRGELGGRLTTQGDVHYDLSKVYQSLCGYDFMLLDQAPDSAASEVFDALRAAFWEEVQRLYPDVSHRDVRLHTAAHLFAIVPLHEVRSRNLRYLRASHSMLLVEGLL
uniref:Aminoglycoside phosphotransferase domain-containing protein n=1 Tax=Pyrodinium bahamense TaxID=73915 RepID=A0A7S0A4S4_9DINO